MPHLEIEENSRTFVCGQSGSGKTRFCIELLADVQRLLVIDTKVNLLVPMNLEPVTRKAMRRFINGEPIRLQIPTYEFAETKLSEFDYYEDIFNRVWIAGDCMVYIDELGIVAGSNPSFPPPNLKRLYMAGREPIIDKGKLVRGNIGMVASSQRPASIPTLCITESQNCAAFYLGNPEDRKRVADYFGQSMREPVPDEHGFYWRGANMRDPVYYSGLTLTDTENA